MMCLTRERVMIFMFVMVVMFMTKGGEGTGVMFVTRQRVTTFFICDGDVYDQWGGGGVNVCDQGERVMTLMFLMVV